jgi:hypothetical protein
MKKLVLVGILAVAMLAGCGGEAEETAAQQQAEAPVDIFAIQTKWLSDFKLGANVAPNGTATELTSTFQPGQSVWYSMAVKNAPPASAVLVVWMGPNETKLGQEMKGIATGQDVVFFQSPDTTAWPPGEYEAQAWVVDEKVNGSKFTMAGPEAATTTDTAATTTAGTTAPAAKAPPAKAKK